jgi:CHASE2 domain-containing sensor protein
MEYADLDLWIDPQVEDYYPVRVNFQSDPAVAGKLTVATVEALCRETADTDESATDAARKKIGASLFDALLPGASKETYRNACNQVKRDESSGLRIRLRIAAPEVAALPWELLYDETRGCFLGTSTQTMLTRFIEPEISPKKVSVTAPIRILVIVPKSLEAATEWRLKMSSYTLKDLGEKIEVRVLDGKATRANIDRELSLNQIHIIHFVGDGVFAENKACLLLDDENSEDLCSVTAKEFSYYFQDYFPLRLIVFQACTSVKRSAALRCMAEELVHLGLPATISTRGGIGDEGTRIFANALYHKLSEGYERGRVDVAVSHARKRLIAERKKGVEFASRLLFMSCPDGVIFEFSDSAVPVPPKKFSSAIRVIAVGLTLSLLVFVASHMKLLSRFWIDDYMSGAMRWAASRPEGTLNKKVMLIVAESANNGDLGSPVNNVEWRKYHGHILEGFALVDQKPRVVVLDLTFDLPGPLDNVAAGIQSAQNQKIRVIGEQQIDDKGQMITTKLLPRTLADALGDSWGDASVGGKLDLPLLAGSVYINEYKIASLPPDTPTPAPEVEVVPSLALKAVMEYLRDSDHPLKSYFLEHRSEVVIKGSDGREIKQVPVVRKGVNLEMLMNYVPNDSVETNTIPYAHVHGWATTPKEQTSKENLERMFSDSIVIIGYNTAADTRSLIGDKTRSGVQINANAISNVLNDEYIPHISGLTDFTVIVVMMSLGILLQTVFKRWLPGDWKLRLPVLKDYLGEIPVPLSLLTAIIVYLLIAYLVFARGRHSFEMAYHLLALLLGYLFIAIFRNKLRLSD